MIKLIDILGPITILWTVVNAWLKPDDPLWFAAIATAFCFWVSIRTVTLCCCGQYWWPASGVIFLTLAAGMHHIGAFTHFGVGWGPAVEPLAAWNMIWAFNLAYLCFAFGMWIYSKLARIDINKLIGNYFAIPITVPRTQRSLLIPAIILFAIGLAASAVLLGGRFAIADVVRVFASGQMAGAKEAAMEARIFLSSGEYRGMGYLEQMRSAVLPMIMVMWLLMALVTKEKLYYWLAGLSGFATAVVMISGLQRGVFMLFVLQIIIVMMVAFKVRPNVRWFYGAIPTFILFYGMSILLGRGKTSENMVENIGFKWDGIVSRLYLSNSLSTVKCFELFPKYEDFRYGMTWVHDIMNLAPGRQGMSLSHEVFEYIWGTPSGGGVHFVAEMWANGGYGMVALASFIVGIFLYWVNLQLLSIKVRTPLSVAYIGLLAFCLCTLGLTGFTAPFNRGIIAVAILYWIFKQFQRINSRLDVTGTDVARINATVPDTQVQDSPAG